MSKKTRVHGVELDEEKMARTQASAAISLGVLGGMAGMQPTAMFTFTIRVGSVMGTQGQCGNCVTRAASSIASRPTRYMGLQFSDPNA